MMIRRNGKEYSCEPCRRAKTRCDHGLPHCAKCIAKGREAHCYYHPAPMTRPHKINPSTYYHPYLSPLEPNASEPADRHGTRAEGRAAAAAAAAAGSPQAQTPYRDPGSGSDKATALDATRAEPPATSATERASTSPTESLQKSLGDAHGAIHDELGLGARVLQLVAQEFSVSRFLIERYFKISQVCVVPRTLVDAAMPSLQSLIARDVHLLTGEKLVGLSKRVSLNSAQTVKYNLQSTCHKHFAQYCGDNIRWEALGIFCALVAAALMLVSPSDELLKGRSDITRLTGNMIQASTSCIELCRAGGPLTDVAVLLIYQNVIVTSLHYGDTNHRTWRRLVDLAGAIFETNLHNNQEDQITIPLYFVEMRRCLFAAAYSIDKSLCTAMERPPMIASHFCRATLPLEVDESQIARRPNFELADLSHRLSPDGWSYGGIYHSTSWIRLRYIMSTFREELLKSILGHDVDTIVPGLQDISNGTAKAWESLPKHMRYPLVDLDTCTERQRLMLASSYLDYLFLEFQVQRNLRRFLESADAPLVASAQQLLSTILGVTGRQQGAETISKGFSWIIIFYGLPSANVLVHELAKSLRPGSNTMTNLPLSRGETIRKLTSFIASLDWIVPSQDGNSEEIQESRVKLASLFDTALDGFETSPTSSYPPPSMADLGQQLFPFPWEQQPMNADFAMDTNDGLWRL